MSKLSLGGTLSRSTYSLLSGTGSGHMRWPTESSLCWEWIRRPVHVDPSPEQHNELLGLSVHMQVDRDAVLICVGKVKLWVSPAAHLDLDIMKMTSSATFTCAVWNGAESACLLFFNNPEMYMCMKVSYIGDTQDCCLVVSDFLFKFLVIGSAGTGKSCLLHQFIENKCKYLMLLHLHSHAQKCYVK